MQDPLDYARKNGIQLEDKGPCQFCGSMVSEGVFECLDNVHHIVKVVDFNNPIFHATRFLSVDALALQHCEIHGPWNNHIHLTRLFLIFEKNVRWDYSKTPQLSIVINQYKKNRREFLTPPPAKQRGKITTSDLLSSSSPEECVLIVKKWAVDVYNSFNAYHSLASSIGHTYLAKYSS